MEEEVESKVRNRHAEIEGKSGKLGKVIIGAILLIVILVIGTIVWYNMSLSGTGTSAEGVQVEIALGSGTNKIASILKEKGLIKSENAFKVYVKLNKVENFQAGKYNITKDMDVPKIVEMLQTGKIFKESKVNITFVEGKTFKYIAKMIAENTNNTEQDVYDLVKDEEYLDSIIEKYWFLTDEIKNNDIYYPLEGYLFPDTYAFEDENVKVEEIFKTLLDKMDKVLANYKSLIEDSKYSVHEILAIASIIENEAIFDKDRKDVSSVIYNRLNANMSVGSDITTYYGAKIDLGTRDLKMSEINLKNPYNTRGPNMEGKLPVGPVCMPGKASIEAAINPSDTEYLFFVADKDGNIFFGKTNAEHEKNISDIKANDAWIQF